MRLLLRTKSATLGLRAVLALLAPKTWTTILPVALGYAFERKPEETRTHRTGSATATTLAFWCEASRPARITEAVLPRQF